MHKIEVGKPYSIPRTSWPEGVEYNWMHNVHELRMFFRNPQPQEVQSVKLGKVEFGLVVEGDIIFLLFRFLGAQKGQRGIDWSDTPYSYHMLPEDRKGLPPEQLRPLERSLLNIILVNAPTGIVLAVRAVSLSHEFTEKLYQAVREQAAKPFDQVKYDRQLRWIQSQYQSKELVSHSIARCVGGD